MPLKKILMRGPNWVGDSVLAIPAMKAVRARFPEAEITLLVRPWVAGAPSGSTLARRLALILEGPAGIAGATVGSGAAVESVASVV